MIFQLIYFIWKNLFCIKLAIYFLVCIQCLLVVLPLAPLTHILCVSPFFLSLSHTWIHTKIILYFLTKKRYLPCICITYETPVKKAIQMYGHLFDFSIEQKATFWIWILRINCICTNMEMVTINITIQVFELWSFLQFGILFMLKSDFNAVTAFFNLKLKSSHCYSYKP